MQELFDNSFLLPAQLGDARRKERGQEEILAEAHKAAWDEKNVKELYGKGKNGNVGSEDYHEYDNQGAKNLNEFLKIHFDPEAIDLRLVRSLVHNMDHGGIDQWNRREQDMYEEKIPDGIRALLHLDMLANEARTLMHGWLDNNLPLNPSLVPDSLSVDHAKAAYVKKLQAKIEPKGFPVAYLKGLEERLSAMVNERAQSLYKDTAKETMDLWRAVNYLRSSKFKLGSVSEFRQSVYGALKERNLQKAKDLIRPRILRNPEAFTLAAQYSTNIAKEEIRTAQVERGNTKRMTPAEKELYKQRRAEDKLREKKREEEKRLEPLKPYIGKVIFDKKGDRLILCIGLGKISRTRTTYDGKTHTDIQKASDMPGMEVRYFPRPQSGTRAPARQDDGIIKWGAFLTRIQSGEYQLQDDITISGDTKEIDTKLFPKE